MNKQEHVIKKVEAGSIAEELGIEAGDILLSINEKPITDIFDYQYFTADEYIVVLIRKSNGEEWELEIEKEYGEDLGLEFENGLMDEYHSCRNKCIFCFIDQMPKGMRDTLYFKDDDSRLSFLQGNYVTLTNMSDEDVERIIAYHLSPINVSIQTMNPSLRCEMLNNRFAGEALKKVKRFYEAGITMNAQIVLCKDVNDGAELEYSIREMANYLPVMESVSVVPVGLTKFREGLYPLEPFLKEDAKNVLSIIHKWQKICYEKHGLHFVHASDEWYLLAEEALPEEEQYDGYLQLENGVGMLTLLKNEFYEALDSFQGQPSKKKITIATGRSPYKFLCKLIEDAKKRYPSLDVTIIPIRNDFFGERITVSGLLTGSDLIAQLKDRDLGDVLLLPCNLLRSGEEVFLDDITIDEVRNALQVEIDIVKSSGQDLVHAIMEE